jgi:hypothetical protein
MTQRERWIKTHSDLVQKAQKNKVPLKAIVGKSWYEGNRYIEEYSKVDNRLKREYRKNKSYYDTVEDYRMDDIIDSYNESRQSLYY